MDVFSFENRERFLQRLESEEFDLAIIGGGILGAGVARDAASRGMKVALIEARDFAFGTSSRSSKLIHGGIRYLENLEFKLVFEALSERRRLFEIAPHLVHPLTFLLPIYEGARVGMFKLGMGMWLYDILSQFEAPQLHRRLTAGQALRHVPSLQPHGLQGAYTYSDAYMDDGRLVLETLRSAVSMGACCLSYVRAQGAEMEDGKVRAVVCVDQISSRKLTVRARHFVSTVGPWTDLLGTALFQNWQKCLRPTKGIHLTFRRRRLPINEAVVMAVDKEERIVFAIPRHDMVIIGTTDTDFKGDPAEVRSDLEDVRYLLKVIGEYFPGARITIRDVVASYAGVRPLVASEAETESKTSREHIILADPRNVTFVAGGKYTTYRLISEEVVQRALLNFSVGEQQSFGHNNTISALNPHCTPSTLERSRLLVPRMARQTQLPEQVVSVLVERHGEEAEVLLAALLRSGEEAPPRTLLHRAEALYAILNTMCFNLADFYLRRSSLFLSEPEHGFDLLEDLSKIFAEHLGWDERERERQVREVHYHAQRELAWMGQLS